MTGLTHSTNATVDEPHWRTSESAAVYEHGDEGRMRILRAGHRRALRTGLDLMPARPLALFGVSPGNGFFTRRRLEIAICGMAHLFDEVAVIIPDTISAHTYRALGYSEKDSRVKARANGGQIRNRCQRAIELAQTLAPAARLSLLDWEQHVDAMPGYADSLAYVRDLFERDPRFRGEVLNKGREVLRSKMSKEVITTDAALECVQYLLKEFAYMRICRQALGRDLVIPYYQDFALGQQFCDGEFDQALAGVGWLIYDIDVFANGEESDAAR